ncbi:glycosyltransferase family 4 protein [Candidatus Gottesmanbacteria bacterium]|nr:glycosyltransferase family 4 protein [Candidatus Gottesmanbacteria bacterium]
MIVKNKKSHKIKVLYLYMFPLWGNGSGAWLREMVTRLAKRKNIEVGILAPDERKLPGVKHFYIKPPQMGVFVGNPELKGVQRYQDMNGKEITDIYTSYLTRTVRVVEEFKPDIIHAFHTAFIPPLARYLKVLYGTKFIITTHGSDLHYLEQDRRLIGLIKDAARVSSYITANSTFTRNWFLEMFGRELSYKTRTIPGGVTIKDVRGMVDKINKDYNLKGKKVVIFTGRLTVHKGVEYLIKAARKIQGEVLILGDGPERNYLQSLINQYKLTNVKILGYFSSNERDILDAFYRRADVYVAPSVWNEPLGLVILESMAQETPVIVTRTGGITSIVKNGYNGYLVRPRNANEIAEKVNKLLSDDALRARMGERAKQTVIRRFTWDKITNRFLNLYRKFSNGNGKNKRPH